MAGVSVRLTKSVIVMCSLAAISLLSLVLPAIMVNTLVYFIIAAGVGLPMATVLLGEYLLLKPFLLTPSISTCYRSHTFPACELVAELHRDCGLRVGYKDASPVQEELFPPEEPGILE